MNASVKAVFIMLCVVVAMYIAASYFSGPDRTPRESTGGSSRAQPAVTQRITISCPDCDEEGIPINLWRDLDASRLACQLPRNVRSGQLLEVDTNNAGKAMARIQTRQCTGWIAQTLLD